MKHIIIFILSAASITSYSSQLVHNKSFTIYDKTLEDALTTLHAKVGTHNYRQYAIIPVLEKDHHGIVITQTHSSCLNEVFIVCGDTQSQNIIYNLMNNHSLVTADKSSVISNVLSGHEHTPHAGAHIASLTTAALAAIKGEYDYLDQTSRMNFNRLIFAMAKNLPQYYLQNSIWLNLRSTEDITHYDAQCTEQLQKTLRTIQKNKSALASTQSHMPLHGKIIKKSRKNI